MSISVVLFFTAASWLIWALLPIYVEMMVPQVIVMVLCIVSVIVYLVIKARCPPTAENKPESESANPPLKLPVASAEPASPVRVMESSAALDQPQQPAQTGPVIRV